MINSLGLLDKYKILYCEDNKDLFITFGMLLKKYTTNIICASDGKVGLQKFHNKKPDIIVTDINMPNLNGLEMIEAIRKIDSEIPIVITTSSEDKDAFLVAIDEGVDKFLIKPIRKDALLSTLEHIVINLENKNMADEYRKKLELEKLQKNTQEIIVQFSQLFMEPILILQNKKIKYINDAFFQAVGEEKVKMISKDSSKIDDILEKRDGFCSSFKNFSSKEPYANKISLRTNAIRKIYQVIVSSLYFKEELEESTVYLFEDITKVEYQKLKLENYSARLEDFLISSKYKKTSVESKSVVKNEEIVEEYIEENKRELEGKDIDLLRRTHVEKISAKDFLSTLNDYVMDDIDELKELEEESEQELHEFFENYDRNQLLKIISKLDQYARAIKSLHEFDELAEALVSTKNILYSIETIDEKVVETIRIFLEGIFSDLKQWRKIIFELEEAKDIHYLDASLFSSCLQLELALTGVKPDDGDDDDGFEFF